MPVPPPATPSGDDAQKAEEEKVIKALPRQKDAMLAEHVLLPGEQLCSGSCKMVQLVLQADGNLALYNLFAPMWQSHTQGADRLVLSGDGDLVLYKGQTKLWSTATHGSPGASAVLLKDCNFVILSPSEEILWQSKSRCRFMKRR